MRYAQGGGLTDAERTTRERLRLQAVERFEGGQKNVEIAAALRISLRSVERWRRAWRESGETGVLSKGSPGRPRLSEAQIARLERELERSPLAHGWADQRWTLARIKTLIGRLFHVSYTVEGTWRLLKRHGWSWQQPTRRAIERDGRAGPSTARASRHTSRSRFSPRKSSARTRTRPSTGPCRSWRTSQDTPTRTGLAGSTAVVPGRPPPAAGGVRGRYRGQNRAV
ncbi:winged helix-turn-helix domain-containing protein, partial [Streptomyces yangpuensis]